MTTTARRARQKSYALAALDETRTHLAELFAGRFTVHERLRWNGLAISYRATAPETEVALAVLPLDCEVSNNRKLFEAAMAEAMAIEEDLFVTVQEASVQLGVPFVAYAYGAQRTLAEQLEDGALAPEFALHVARAILRGLGTAHEQGVFHGDLTPANVLCDPTGHDVQVVGLGFGPMLRSVTSDSTGPTGRGSGDGAVRYLAPEILAGERGSAAADVYAVGALLYRMLSGSPPGKGELSDGGFPGLADAVRKAMAHHAEERYASAAAMLDALDLTPELQREPSAAVPLWDGAKGADKEPEPAPKSSRSMMVGMVVILLVAAIVAVWLGTRGSGEEPGESASATDGAETDEEGVIAEQASVEDSAGEEAPAPPEDDGSGAPGEEVLAERAEEVVTEEDLTETGVNEPELIEADSVEADVAEDDVAEDDVAEDDEEEAGEEEPDGVVPNAAAVAEGSPLAPPLPPFLARTMERIAAGERFEDPDFRAIYGWIARHDGDIRGHLVLSRAFIARRWYTAALERYEHLLLLDANAALRDPQTLDDLIRIAGYGEDMVNSVFPLLRRHYRATALARAESILAETESRFARQRMQVLVRRLRAMQAN